MLNKIRGLYFLRLLIIGYYFILANTTYFKNDLKANGNWVRVISLKKKKTYIFKIRTISFLKNWERKYFKRTNSINDFFSELSGEKNSKNLSIEHFNLTPKLKKTVTLFQSMPNDPYYKSQQVILLGKRCPPMPASLKNRPNQVLGCQSTVYIYPKVEAIENRQIITWLGDSNGLLTKGIVYILVDGLSGYTPEEIIKVNPNFIMLTGITEFLTMSRINGYQNIMSRIKMLSKIILNNRKK